jgi:Fe-S-cluster-containing dehydrogenase component
MAARMKFICDTERCIDCNGCWTACKNEHELPWGVNRRRVVTISDGVPGEHSISVACMHCTNAPCMAVCPVDCFYHTQDGIVLHDKDMCIGCGYCFYACPFGAPQFPETGAFNHRGKMDKCTFCAGGPEPDTTEAEFKKYGRNRTGRATTSCTTTSRTSPGSCRHDIPLATPAGGLLRSRPAADGLPGSGTVPAVAQRPVRRQAGPPAAPDALPRRPAGMDGDHHRPQLAAG